MDYTPMNIHRSIFVFILMVVSITAHALDRAPQAAAAEEKVEPLAEFLPGTRWFWEGSEHHVLEFRKDGTVELDYWKLPTDWKVTEANEVTITMHMGTGDLTSTITLTDDRSSFSGIKFRGGVIAKSPRVRDERFNALAEFLPGTRWFWEGSKDHILEFQKDGALHLDFWTLPTDWRVTGPREVTFTMHFKTENKTATINFTENRSSFTGTQFRGGVISKSPRASAVVARNQ